MCKKCNTNICNYVNYLVFAVISNLNEWCCARCSYAQKPRQFDILAVFVFTVIIPCRLFSIFHSLIIKHLSVCFMDFRRIPCCERTLAPETSRTQIWECMYEYYKYFKSYSNVLHAPKELNKGFTRICERKINEIRSKSAESPLQKYFKLNFFWKSQAAHRSLTSLSPFSSWK